MTSDDIGSGTTNLKLLMKTRRLMEMTWGGAVLGRRGLKKRIREPLKAWSEPEVDLKKPLAKNFSGKRDLGGVRL